MIPEFPTKADKNFESYDLILDENAHADLSPEGISQDGRTLYVIIHHVLSALFEVSEASLVL